MKVAIGSDHAGFELKNKLKNKLAEQNIEVIDVGPSNTDSVDYPDFAKKVCDVVLAQDNTLGVLICGSGIGMSISANKIKGIRAALVTSIEMAQMTKKHNNANVLCLSSRMIDAQLNIEMVQAWLSEEFEGGRHQKRLDKITNLEKNNS